MKYFKPDTTDELGFSKVQLAMLQQDEIITFAKAMDLTISMNTQASTEYLVEKNIPEDTRFQRYVWGVSNDYSIDPRLEDDFGIGISMRIENLPNHIIEAYENLDESEKEKYPKNMLLSAIFREQFLKWAADVFRSHGIPASVSDEDWPFDVINSDGSRLICAGYDADDECVFTMPGFYGHDVGDADVLSDWFDFPAEKFEGRTGPPISDLISTLKEYDVEPDEVIMDVIFRVVDELELDLVDWNPPREFRYEALDFWEYLKSDENVQNQRPAYYATQEIPYIEY